MNCAVIMNKLTVNIWRVLFFNIIFF